MEKVEDRLYGPQGGDKQRRQKKTAVLTATKYKLEKLLHEYVIKTHYVPVKITRE